MANSIDFQKRDAIIGDRAGLRAVINHPESPAAAEIIAAADALRAQTVGNEVYLRGLIEISSYCRNNCRYCGLRRDNRQLSRYRMSPAEIVASAITGAHLNYRTIVLQAGEDPGLKAKELAAVIREIKSYGLVVTLSLGEREPWEYALWRKAGAERYLMRHETADAALYRKLHPGQYLDQRIRRLKILKDLDYQVGMGFMVGIPGQTAEILLADLDLLEQLQAEMVGIGPFIPHPDTPLGSEKPGTLAATLLMVALARLTLPYALIPATTALETIHPTGREAALQAGANVVMPLLTPLEYRKAYQIYPNKIGNDETTDICRGSLARKIASIGRSIGTGPGHNLNWLQRRLPNA